jgi:hypothetical protein
MKKLGRSEMKNLRGGVADTTWVCTFTYTNGTTHVVTLPNTAGGPAGQCMCDEVCLGEDTCHNVDCAGSGRCPY